DAEGAVEYLVGDYQRIIADLREKEARLLDLNRQLSERITDVERINRYLLSSISTGVALLDAQGRVIGLNDLAAERLNCRRTDEAEDYVGLFAELPELKRRVEAALVQPESDEFDLLFSAPGDSERSLRVSIFPLTENDGSLSELALFIADQTQLARAQKRLEDSRRLATLGEMAAGLAHQLRNSISAALGFGSLARRRASVAEASVEPIESLLKELHEEAALVDRFLSFARPLALSAELLAITDWLTDCLESYRARPESRERITVHVDPELERLTLEIDPLLLKQALVNLVDNALRAAVGSNDPVRIRVSRSGERVIIEVRDSGPGVPADDRERIFTPFYSGSPDGAGLGLPLARKIVELHGGSLELADEPSAGAVFRLRLPLSGDEATGALERIPAEAGSQRIDG
ncbi:MAG TPA: ATP-binding protein, partial [candidate division Zixibacteria bacterium]|nr:ATP-binding protein [candidate division Zixibacteria bacterium]